jgi:hypothetical protein
MISDALPPEPQSEIGHSTAIRLHSQPYSKMAKQREAVTFLVAGGLSVPRACTLVHMARSTFRYLAQPRDDSELLAQIPIRENSKLTLDAPSSSGGV